MIVIFLVADSVRFDAPGFVGGPAPTPTLDRLAAQGVISNELFVSGTWTIPSLMSMLTGDYPNRIGVARWRHPFPARRPTLLTAFESAGFEVSCFHPYPKWGFLTVPGAGTIGNSQDPEAVVRALSGPRSRDRFVLIHHWWTHLPYINYELSIPKWHATCDFCLDSLGFAREQAAAKLEESYHKTITYLSEELIPRYLDAAGAGGEDVLLVLTSDHGENWGESMPEGRRVENVYDLHGRWFADETLRVPLLIWGRGSKGVLPSGRRVTGLMRGIDVGPTIADLAGIDWPGPLTTHGGVETVDQGIGPGGESMEIPGKSLMECLYDPNPTDLTEVLTFSSQNTHVPLTMPAQGPLMWRTIGLMKEKSWFVWDGVDQRGTAPACCEDGDSDDRVANEIFERLEKHRLRSVHPGPKIEDDELDRLRGAGEHGDEVVEGRLRTLGYLD